MLTGAKEALLIWIVLLREEAFRQIRLALKASMGLMQFQARLLIIHGPDEYNLPV